MANEDLERIEYIDEEHPNPFISSPGDLLSHYIIKLLRESPDGVWTPLFGKSMEAYERDDYSFRELPALRVYNLQMTKEQESHYIRGDIMLDVIFPPSIRREQRQRMQDIVSSALLQQFRRPTFFAALQAVVPGLNEMGKVFSIDKTLGLKVDDGIAPLTQITANFRLDLKDWDAYLEMSNRTKDDPFEKTLQTLRRIATTISALDQDDVTVEVTVTSDQSSSIGKG